MSSGLDYKALSSLWLAALAAGLAVFLIGLSMGGQFIRPELVPIVISFAVASIVFGAVFYLGCLVMARDLTKYVIADDTEVRGAIVEMVTRTAASGDPQIDRWVKRFVFARNTFGFGIIPVLILAGLFLFG